MIFLGNMAKSVEKVPVTFADSLNAFQVLHGGDVLSHFVFIALYFIAALLFDGVAAARNKITSDRKSLEEIAL